MKIIQINATYGNADSTGRNVKETHQWLKDHNFESIVYTASFNEQPSADPNVRIFSNVIDKKLHGLLSRLTGLQGYYSVLSTKKLITHLKKDNPDGVIVHVLHSNCINFPFLFRYLAQNEIPTILVLHDCWYFTGHCCHFTQSNCVKWQQDCRCCPQIHDWNKSWFFDTAHKCLQDKKKWFDAIPQLGVVGVSDWITGEARKSILKDAAILERIYNWIDLETFKPQDTTELRKQLGIEQSQKILLGVASGWSDRKGLAEMLQAAKEFPDSKVIMVGNVSQNTEVPSNMLCVGTIRQPELLAKYYAMADVFVNPSIQETFGKTTAEAICCGTPVVAYKTTACTELVGETRGITVELGETKCFMEAIRAGLAEGKGKYQPALHEFALDNFCMEHNIETYLDVIKELSKKV
jgi:glycosyltransferase involved in cell wall biosynthesis